MVDVSISPDRRVPRPVPIPEDKILLVSFPKSGSNWVRYCIEHFSGRRTPGSVRTLQVKDGPTVIDRKHFLRKIDRRAFRHNTVSSKPRSRAGSSEPVWPITWLRRLRKARQLRRIEGNRRLLLLLRSPFALYPRVGATALAAMRGYLGNIEVFERCRRDKLLVYYEDLVRDFREMEKILSFAGIPYDLAGFDVAEHQQRSLELYAQGHDKPATGRNLLDSTFHSRRLDRDTRLALRAFCKETLGDNAYAHYLGRYDAEAELDLDSAASSFLPTRSQDEAL
jgi:hypothetical protein